MPWIALVCDISGVWSIVGTFEITSKPTKAARTKIVISVIRVMRHSTSFGDARCGSRPACVMQAPATTSSSKSRRSEPSSATSRPRRFSMFFA